MNQSIGLIILQFFGIALGLFSVFFVAGSIPAQVYAVVGVYGVMSTITLVFSNTGFETYAIRNILAWQEKQEIAKIKLIVTQAIIFRTLMAIIVFIPLIVYAMYMSSSKFNGQYLVLFLLMGLLSIFSAINDAVVLILKSFNMYFFAALATYSVNVFGKLIALLLFFRFGFNVYIYSIILLPLFVTLPIVFMIRRWISLEGVFYKENVLACFKNSKSFALSSYVSYVYSSLDQLLVSFFLSAEILGSFTIGKNLLNIGKGFIENIFDPMLQGLIRYRNNLSIIREKFKSVLKVRNILLIISIILIPIIIIFVDQALSLLRLNRYPFLNYFVVFIYLSQIAHIGMKVKYNYICLFFPQSYYLKLIAISGLLLISSFAVIILIDAKFLFLHVLFSNLIMILYSRKLFNKINNPINNTI